MGFSFSENLARAKDALHRAQQRQQEYANQHRRDAEFSVGDEVLLSSKYLNLHLPEGATLKLYPKYTGPLKVLEVISPVAYKLKLLPTMKCHNVFHISLLKPADFFSQMNSLNAFSMPPHQCVLKTIKPTSLWISSWVTSLALPSAILKQNTT